uniref:Solute carrier family 15 (Oligopeptide transporter), member 1 n=1 Tax=Globodera pallida TaxID=36090 RepID=A0A183CM14_GLOPA
GGKNGRLRRPDHWLDYARPKFDEHLIAGVKSMLAITVLFIPIVFFWALYDQQGSTWVLQARRMDGRIGWFTILPDQVNTLNPLLVLILVPLFEAWLYPTTNKMCKVTPLRKMAIGAILAAVAFCMAGFLQELSGIDAPFFSSVSVDFAYSTEKTDVGKTRFYFLVLPNSVLNGVKCYALDDTGTAVASTNITNGGFIDIQPGFFTTSQFYYIAFGDCTTGHDANDAKKPKCAEHIEVHAQMGAAYVLDLVSSNASEPIELVRPNSVNILWQVPQLFVMTVGEILLSVTGLEFSYSQAAPSMKSVVQALWLLTVFFGNIIDIEFFVYAALMFAVIGLFVLLSMRYKYVDENNLHIPDSPERSRRSSDEFSTDRRSDDDRLELGRNNGTGGGASGVISLPSPMLIEKADRN